MQQGKEMLAKAEARLVELKQLEKDNKIDSPVVSRNLAVTIPGLDSPHLETIEVFICYLQMFHVLIC